MDRGHRHVSGCLPREAAQSQGRVTRAECSGTVVDFRAQAVPGAEVVCCRQVFDYAAGRIRWNVLGRAATDARGKFRVSGEANDLAYLWVFVRKSGLSVGWYGSVYQGPMWDLSICLRQSEAYVGTVVDENGQGVSDATVRVNLKLNSMCQWSFPDPEGWCTARTDGQGRFRIEQIPPGSVADFRVDAPGKAVRFTHDERGAEEGMGYRVGRDEVRIVLKPEAILRGRVIDEDSGKPVGGVQLLARPDTQYSNYYCVDPVMSEQDGTFRYRGLQAGVYSLQIVAPQDRMLEWVGRDVKVAAQAGRAVDVKVPVGKGGLIEVTVLDAATGLPLESARVIVDQKATDGRSAVFFGVFHTDARGMALGEPRRASAAWRCRPTPTSPSAILSP